MAGDAQKTWLARTLNQFGQKKAAEAIQLLGKALPCSVAAIPTAGIPIVVVKFEINAAPFTLPHVTVPVFGFEYARFPIHVGCKGVVFPADFYLGGISGLGGGTADLTQPSNLSALVFFPVGNAGWTASEAPNKLVLYGPDGVILRDANSVSRVVVTADGVEMFLDSGKALKVHGDIEVDGNVYALFGSGGVINLSSHIHHQPNDSHGDTEQPTTPPIAGS